MEADAMTTSGPRTVCSRCDSTNLKFVCESFDAIDRIYVGTVLCRACAATLLYSRRSSEPLPQYDPTEPQQHALPLEVA